MRLGLFVKLKYQLNTKILFVGIKQPVRDLLFDLNNCAWPANQRYTSHIRYVGLNDVSALSDINSL